MELLPLSLIAHIICLPIIIYIANINFHDLTVTALAPSGLRACVMLYVCSKVFGFYEELLSARFPHSSYKLVFVDCLYEDVCNYSTLGLFSTNLLHSSRVIDQVMSTRRIVSKAVAMQYFGCYVLQQTW